MKNMRKGIALALLAVLSFGNSLSAFAAEGAPPDRTSDQSTRLEAVVSPASSYSVTIPEQIALGRLPAQGDLKSPYTVEVSMTGAAAGTVTVTGEKQTELLPVSAKSRSVLPCYNRFGTQQFTESGSADGELTIRASDIRAAAPGAYAGTLHFSIRYTPGQDPDPTDPTDPVGPTDPEPTDPEPSVPDSTDPLPTNPNPTDPEPSVPRPTDPVIPDDGSRLFTADISMRKDGHFDQESMCDPLFHQKAEIRVKDGTAHVTVYVIDPVPAFASEGTPVRDILLHYNGQQYPAAMDSAHRVMKYFDERAGFIPTSGDYPAAPITFEVPEAAIADSLNQKLSCTAYVNAVMHTDVKFFVVFSNLTEIEAPEPPPETVPPTEPPAPTEPRPTEPAPTESPVLPPEPGAPLPPAEDGVTYFTANVSMRKDGHFTQQSMCDPLFYQKADIRIKGNTATLTLYVIDPVPKFVSEGTPLSKVHLHYQGQRYSARVDSGHKVTKYFPAQPGFIETSDNYPATPVVVQLPAQAITDSLNQKLSCTAYVNAVMHTDVKFFVVLSDLTKVSSAPSNQPAGPGGSGISAPESGETLPADTTRLELGQGEKQYFESDVTMHRADDFERLSMCNPLFFPKADIVFQGELAQLTLYVIDPVPKFAEEGTPLSDVAFLYDGRAYAAEYHPDSGIRKFFAEAPGFIPESGDYTVTPVSVVLPKAAIADSAEGGLMASAFINTVMKTTQKFYVVLGALTETDGSAVPEAENPTVPGADAGGAVPPVSGDGPIRIDTGLFPLSLLAMTVLIAGGSFGFVWYRRHGKD